MPAALAELATLSQQETGDQLLYLMEYGSALHIAGEYEASNKVFMQADKMSDVVDYHSASRTALATLGGEEMLQYKGESYEKLLINAHLAMNFMMLGKKDSAMVEVRRINDKINKIRNEGREDYEYNPFAIYLSALLYESDHQYDDAYIAFEKAYKLKPDLPALPQDLIRSARLARRMDSLAKWKAEFPDVQDPSKDIDRSWGEIIVIFEQGWGPRKTYSYQDARFPMLVPERSETQSARVDMEFIKQLEVPKGVKRSANGESGQKFSGRSQLVYDLETAAIRTLEADYQWMVARKIGAFVAKEVVADQIRQKNEALGLLADVVMHASDRADLRSWTILPQTYQIVRVAVPPGIYKMRIQGYDSYSSPTGDWREEPEIKINAGQKRFYIWRSLR